MFKVLNYGGNSPRLFSMLYRPSDQRDGVFDIIIIDRDNLQNDMEDILTYSHKDTKLLVDIVSESGCITDFFNEYNRVVEAYKEYNFFLVSDFDSPVRKEYDNSTVLIKRELSNFLYFGTPYTDSYWDCFELHHNQHRENAIMCFNGSTRVSRVLLLSHFLKNNLIDEIRCSFKFYDHHDETKLNEKVYDELVDGLLDDNYINKTEHTQLLDYKNYLPLNYDNFQMANRKVRQEVYSCIFNVVTENTYGSFCCEDIKDTNTFTEKTFKPFMMEQIPIFVAQPYHVELLREIGYDVFDDIIDHSYDEEPDEEKRMELIIQEIKKTLDKDGTSFYYDNLERFLHNRELTYQHTHDGYRYLKEFLKQNNLL